MNEEPVVESAEFGSVPNENIANTRVRILTEKGQEEKIRRLKNNQTTKISAVSKQRNALTSLMENENNLHSPLSHSSHLGLISYTFDINARPCV